MCLLTTGITYGLIVIAFVDDTANSNIVNPRSLHFARGQGVQFFYLVLKLTSLPVRQP
jgi:hypothetical protein